MYIGIDIGGTKIAGGLIGRDGAIVRRFHLRSRDYADAEALAKGVSSAVRELLDAAGVALADIERLGIGIPGTVDWIKGNILYSPNLFGRNVPFADMVEAASGMRPTLVQDSWAGAYAEYLMGQERRFSDMMCVTLGTGIGCGLIRNGCVYGGDTGTAGEIGHTSIDRNGRLCSCGRRGCLETYASGTAVYKQAMTLFPEKMGEGGAERVFELADAGDEQARALLAECADHLAFGLAALINLTGCGVIFISGGMSCHEKWLIAPLQEGVTRYGYPAWSERVTPRIRRAALGEDAPMIGAALLDADHIRRS